MKFENKVTLVTGGNFGIGYGIAKKFAEEGSEIAIVARNEERAKNVIKDLENQGFVAKFFKTDVSKEEDVKKMIEEVLNVFGNKILFIFFGIISLVLCFQDFRFWRNPRKSKTGWLAQHIGKITGAYIASVTAFLVGGMKVQGLMVWILPSIIGNAFIIYYIIKIRGGFKKRKKVTS